mgnify:CR=1 FL=1
MQQAMTIKLYINGQAQTSLPFLSFQEKLKFLIKVLDSHETSKISVTGSYETSPGERTSVIKQKQRREKLTGLLMKRSAYSLAVVGSYSVVMTFRSEDLKTFANCGRLDLEKELESAQSTESKEQKQKMSFS